MERARITAYEQATEEFECTHDVVEIRERTHSNDTKHLYKQCTHCGQTWGPIKKTAVAPEIARSAPPFDEELPKRRAEVIRARAAELSPQLNAEWWEDYGEHLESPRWEAIRRKVLDRARGVCEGCGERKERFHVHHKTYQRTGYEMLFDLVALCIDCHRIMHPDKDIR